MKKFAIIYEFFIFFLILFYLTIIIVGYSDSPVLTSQQIKTIDYGFICFFVIEYIIRLYYAPKKWLFVKKNIFDLIAMIPFDALFRTARLMRLLRLIRILKLSKTIQGIFKSGGLNYVLIFSAFITTWGAISIYVIEKGVNPNINSFNDALWWAIVTATTVGYGDISPMTVAGRIVAGVLMLIGIGLIGSITGSVATYFSNIHETVETDENDPEKNVTEHDDLKKYIQHQIKFIKHLSEDELEHLVSSIRVLYKNERKSSMDNHHENEM